MKNATKSPRNAFFTKFILLSLGLSIASLSPLGSQSAQAATQTWTGATSGTWETTSNWSATTPGSSDIALWNSSSANLTVTLGAPESVLGLQVTNPTGAVTLNGSTLSIGTSGIDMSAATQNLTIGSGLTLGVGNQTWNVATGKTLTLTGTLARSTGATLLIDKSTNTGTVTASPTLVNSIVGPWAIIKNNNTAASNNTANGYTFATVTAGNIVAYTGATPETGSGAWGGIPSGDTNTVNYDLSSGGTLSVTGLQRIVNTIRYTGTGATQQSNSNISNLMVTNAIMNAGTGTFTIGGGSNFLGIQIGTNNELVLAAETAGITINNSIQNNGATNGGTAGGTGGTASALTIMGAGGNIVTLAGGNTYTGATTISAGTLSITGGFISSTSLTIASGATLTTSVNNSLSGGTGTAPTAAWTIAGTLTGTANAQTISTNVTLNNGTMSGNTFAGFGTFLASSTGTLTANGASNTISAGNFGLSATETFNTPLVTDALSISSVVGATSALNGGIVKTGSGTVTLTGANTFTGDINVNAGTLVANKVNNNLNPTNSALGNPQVARNINVNNGGTLQFAAGDTFGGNDSSVASTLVINNGGTVTNANNVFTTFGAVQLNGGTLTGTGGAAPTFQMYSLQGTVTVGGTSASIISGNGTNAGYHLSANTTFNVADATGDANSDLNVSGLLIDRQNSLGAGALTKSGAGTMTLSGANTYTGATTISGGTLQIGSGGTLGALSTSSAITDNATLAFNRSNTVTQGTDFASTIGGSGNLTQAGSGTTILTGSNTYGTTTISNGTLQVGTGGTVGTLGTGAVADNAALVFNRSNAMTVGSSISGSGSLTQAGLGTTNVTANNSYTGATNVNGGTLLVNGNQSAATGAVTVASGATLGGSGTIGGATTIQAGGFLSPGNSIGTTTFGSGLTINGTYLAQLGTADATPAAGISDRAVVTGALDLTGGTLSLSDNGGANGNGSAGAGAYQLITNTGARTGTFSTVTNPLSATLHENVVYLANEVDLNLYRLASASTHTPEPVNLGLVHIGGTASQALTISNSAANDGFSEKLNASIGGATGDATASGSFTQLAAGSTDSTNLLAGIDTSTGGNKSGTATITLNSDGTGTSGYGTTGIGTQTVNVSGQVFNGSATWTGVGSSWGSGASANWMDSNGINAAPGTFTGFDKDDSATFDNSGTANTTVSLDGSNPSLKAVTFNSSGSYTIAQGSGGALTLKNSGAASATVTDTNGNHTISAPVTLASDTIVDVVNSSDKLTTTGGINGIKGMVKTGAGTLEVQGSNSYTGATSVNAGTLAVQGSLTSAISVSAGTLSGSGSTTGAVVIGDGTGGHDAFLSPGNNGVGTFTTASSLSLASDATYVFDLDSTSAAADKVVANGVSIDPSAMFTFNDLGDGSGVFNGEVFTILENLAAGAFNNPFANLAEGATIVSNGVTYTASYLGGIGGNDLVLTASLTAVPEPATYGALAGLLLSGLSMTSIIRRRNRAMV